MACRQESETFLCVSWVCHCAYCITTAVPLVTRTPRRTMNVTWKPPHAGFELLGAFKHTLKPSGLNEENSASYSSLISYENCRGHPLGKWSSISIAPYFFLFKSSTLVSRPSQYDQTIPTPSSSASSWHEQIININLANDLVSSRITKLSQQAPLLLKPKTRLWLLENSIEILDISLHLCERQLCIRWPRLTTPSHTSCNIRSASLFHVIPRSHNTVPRLFSDTSTMILLRIH